MHGNRPAFQAYETLNAHGAHFVLLNPGDGERGKRPIWSGHRKRRPSLDAVWMHLSDFRGNIGLYPHSVGTSALDVDTGDIFELVAAAPPLANLETRRGWHCYYEDEIPRPSGKFSFAGCTGEIRSANNYLKLHPGGPDRLASALDRKRGETSWPLDLFDAANLPPLSREVAPLKGGRVIDLSANLPPVLPDISTVRVGRRHISIFDHTRWHFYGKQDRGQDDERSWHGRILQFAEALNVQLQEPLKKIEIQRMAWGISSWIWSGHAALDHSLPAQRRRGIKSAYGNATAATVAEVDRRHEEARQMRGRGYSVRKIEALTGLAKSQVQRLTREVDARAGLDEGIRSCRQSGMSIVEIAAMDPRVSKSAVGRLLAGDPKAERAARDARIVALREAGLSVRRIAAETGVPRSTVGRVAKSKASHFPICPQPNN